jgi:uncharacterized protein (TIGR04255 family)
MSWPRLSKAPIKEALIEIQVVRADNARVEDLLCMHEEIRSEYPIHREQFETRTEIQIQGKVPSTKIASHNLVGYLFDSADRQRVAQARQRGFAFSRLGSYDNWDSLVSDARSLWEVYTRHARPTAVTRIAVRFINELTLPLPFADFREFILTAPDVAPQLPQELAGFLLRLQLPFPEAHAYAIVTEHVKPGEHGDTIPVILDIDVFDPTRVDPSSDRIWQRLGELRAVKNDIFFRTLTPKTVEMYK